MSIATAVSFGSFGDIVTIVQLVSHLCDALNDVTGAPAEIEALSADLNGYMVVLSLAEDILLHKHSYFEPRTRVAIEGGIKRCKDTLLAIQRHVDSFAARLQPRAGRNTLLAYAAAVRWRLFGGRKEVSALHARLDKQLSFVQMCLGLSQSNGQRALHDSAERSAVISEQILMLVHTLPPRMTAGASVMQVRHHDSGTVYAGFAAVPLHMISAYLEPLVDLLDPHRLSRGLGNRLKSVAADHAGQILLEDEFRFRTVPIFDYVFFSSESGERHVLLGIPPFLQNDLVNRILSDVVHGEFYLNVDAGLYVAEERKAHFVSDIQESYNRLLDLVPYSFYMIMTPSDHSRVQSIVRSLDSFPYLTCPKSMAALDQYESRLHREEKPNCAERLNQLFDLVTSAPAIPEYLIRRSELQRLSFSTTPRGVKIYHFPRSPAALIFNALAKRPGSTRLGRAYRCTLNLSAIPV